MKPTQAEYEDLFYENSVTLNDAPVGVLAFSNGNHKRSLVGYSWYYFGETETEVVLYKDVIVGETDGHILIDMYEDDMLLNSVPIAISKDKMKDVYPIQDLFPFPMTDEKAKSILKAYVIEETRNAQRPSKA